jgi:hypothetical protein
MNQEYTVETLHVVQISKNTWSTERRLTAFTAENNEQALIMFFRLRHGVFYRPYGRLINQNEKKTLAVLTYKLDTTFGNFYVN